MQAEIEGRIIIFPIGCALSSRGIQISVRSRVVRQVREFTAFEHVPGGATDLDELALLIDLVLVEFARLSTFGAAEPNDEAA